MSNSFDSASYRFGEVILAIKWYIRRFILLALISFLLKLT
jgi:hypothetical protein